MLSQDAAILRQMKKRVLLIDESLTVQKVVALTLDKSRYSVAYAKSRNEAMTFVADSPPNLILVSDQVTDVTVPSFPKEVEAWLGRNHRPPPIILITGQDIKEMRHYAGVLKKPFSPQALQSLVTEHTAGAAPEAAPVNRPGAQSREAEDANLQSRFNEAFNDDAKLTRETFEAEAEAGDRTLLNIPAPAPEPPRPDRRPPAREPHNEDSLWSAAPPPPKPPAAPAQARRVPEAPIAPSPEIMRADDSMAYKGMLESQVESTLAKENLNEIVQKVLDRIVPPIVERLVQERLDRLLKDQEDFVELKS